MKVKRFTALCSLIALTLAGAGYADGLAEASHLNSLSGSGNLADAQQNGQQMQKQMGNKQMTPMQEQGAPLGESKCTTPKPQQVCQTVPVCSPCYNMPAAVNVQNGYDFFGTASFIYWMASQDGLDFSQYPTGTAAAPLFATGPLGHGDQSFHKPKFKPGFKVGLGLDTDFDDWSVFAEYTWFHNTTEQSYGLDTGNSFYLAGPKYLVNGQGQSAPFSIMGQSLNSKWHLGMDLFDFSISRCYYVGKRLTLEPMAGLRAAWIEQSFHVELGDLPGLPPGENESNEIHFLNENESWAIGPRVGVKSQWLLGSGFRVDGKAAASLLFTRYTELSFNANVPTAPLTFGATPVTLSPISLHYEGHYGQVRPNAEIGLGFAWGSYFFDDGYHFDLCATYDFQVFWSQSLLRSLAETVNTQSGANPRDLYLQGLTLTARLDF